MKKNLLFAFLSFVSSLFSNYASTDGFQAAFVENVNIITGDYYFTKINLEVNGAIPLKHYMSYLSRDAESENGGWYHFDHVYLFYKSDPKPTIAFFEQNGSLLKFVKKNKKHKKLKGNYYLVDGQEIVGMTNDPSRDSSGKSNKKNYEIEAKKKEVLVYCPNGNVRHYSIAEQSLVLSKLHLPHQIRYVLNWERTPAGNYTFYEFDNDGFIKRIKTTDITHQKIYSSFQWNREKNNEKNDFLTCIHGSDNKKVFFKRKKMKVSNNKYQLHLTKEVFGNYLIPETIVYNTKKAKVGPRIAERILPNHRKIKIEYYGIGDNRLFDKNEHIKKSSDPRCYRVKALYAPIGDSHHYYITHQFFYEPAKIGEHGGKTRVFDANNNLTVYEYSPYLRLESIEHYANENNTQIFQSKETFVWGKEGTKDETYLLCHAFYDKERFCIKAIRYHYDIYGNVINEQSFGNLTGKNSEKITFDTNNLPIENGIDVLCIKRQFSQDGKNLLLSEEKNDGRLTKLSYSPETSQLTAKYSIENGKILLRQFYCYDSDNFLSQEITDDGANYNKDDLSCVTHRYIKKIHRHQSGEFVGMPFAIEDQYLNLSTSKEALIRKLSLKYNSHKEIIQEDIYDKNNVYRYSNKYVYDENGQLISQTNSLDETTTFKYDQNFNRIQKTAPKLTTKYQYNYLNCPVLKNECDCFNNIHSTQFKYDRCYNLIEETDYLGNTTSYKNNLLGKPIVTSFPKIQTADSKVTRPVIHNEYDIFGNQITLTDAKGHTTKTYYTIGNKPYLISYPDGGEKKYEYHLDGKLKSETDQSGTKTTYSYDAFDRITSKTTYSKTGIELFYEAKEYNTFDLIQEIDAEGFVTKYLYDDAGKLIKCSKEDESVLYSYDSIGRLETTKVGGVCNIQKRDYLDQIIEERIENESGNLQYLKRYEYDENGNKKAVIRFIENKESKESYVYDGFNRIRKYINPIGNATNYTYAILQNDFGPNLLETVVIDPISIAKISKYDSFKRQVTSKTLDKNRNTIASFKQFYDVTGKLTKRIDRVLNNPNIAEEITSWDYDEMGRLTQNTEAENSPDEKTIKYSYTKNGLLEKIIKPDGTEITQSFNGLNQLIEQISNDKTIHYQFTYNRLGYLLQSDDLTHNTSTKRTVDHSGKVLQEIFANGLFVENTYDLAGNRIALNLFDGSSIEYAYDGGYLKEIFRNNKMNSYFHTFLKYDLDGNLLEEKPSGNFNSTTFKRNEFGNISQINSDFFSQKVLTIDPEGKILSQQQQTLLECTENNYTYDALKQVVQENGKFKNDYAYDSLFNRISKNDENFETNKLNQITSSSSSKFKYDPNGNLIQIDDNTFLTYDAFDRLISYENEKIKVIYTYDSFNRRTSKKSSSFNNPINIENYFYDGQNEIGATDIDFNILQFRVLTNSQNAERGASILLELAGKTYLPIHDIFGNLTQIVTIDGGKIFESYAFDSFGIEQISDANGSPQTNSQNPWRFSSKRSDDETSFVYFGRRYYFPKLGRWISADPKGYADGILNLYAYILNDPLNHFDLYGLKAWKEGIIRGFQLEFDETYRCPITKKTLEADFEFGVRDDPLFDIKASAFSGIDNHTRSEWVSQNKNSNIIYFHINGVATTYEDALSNAMYIKNLAKNKINLKLLYNPTHGLSTDILECRMLMSGNSTTPSIELRKELRYMLASNPFAFIKLIPHSQGCAIAFNAINQLTKEERQRISVLGVAPAKIIPSDLVSRAKNIANRWDVIPKIYNSKEIRDKELEYVSNKIDHFFQSETFRDKLRNFINE